MCGTARRLSQSRGRGDRLEGGLRSASSAIRTAARRSGRERPARDRRCRRLGKAGGLTDLGKARTGANGSDDRGGPLVECRLLRPSGLGGAPGERLQAPDELGPM